MRCNATGKAMTSTQSTEKKRPAMVVIYIYDNIWSTQEDRIFDMSTKIHHPNTYRVRFSCRSFAERCSMSSFDNQNIFIWDSSKRATPREEQKWSILITAATAVTRQTLLLGRLWPCHMSLNSGEDHWLPLLGGHVLFPWRQLIPALWNAPLTPSPSVLPLARSCQRSRHYSCWHRDRKLTAGSGTFPALMRITPGFLRWPGLLLPVPWRPDTGQ